MSNTIFDTTNFWAINWYYILALLVSSAGLIIAYKNFKKRSGVKPDNTSSPIINNSSPVNIINNINTTDEKEHEKNINEERLKGTTKILFVDDNHTDYKMVSILKRAGWTKTKSVKDITDLDAQVVIESDIIFVDINGVGLSLFEDQGLGLASALKIKYPKKKIVIYSSETTGDRFHKALRQVDDCLPKNAEPYQFINLVENFSKAL